MKIITFALELKTAFLFEKWNKPYLKYGGVNLAKEKAVFGQEYLWNCWLCQLAERCVA